MTIKIQAPPQATQFAATKETSAADKAKADVAKVGRDFEAILVRQMLTSTKVAGKAGGYADMAVESLATSITAAGGLGMGRAIEQALSAHNAPPAAGLGIEAAKKMTALPQVSSGAAVVKVGE